MYYRLDKEDLKNKSYEELLKMLGWRSWESHQIIMIISECLSRLSPCKALCIEKKEE